MTLFVSSEQQKNANFSHAYFIAGEHVYSQQPIALLEEFKVDFQQLENVVDISDSNLVENSFDIDLSTLIFQGEGSFSGGMKQVAVWERNGIQLLRIGEHNFSLTNLVTNHVQLLNQYQSDQLESAEILLGPPLLTLLAKQSIFCLHAGAIATEHGTVVFIGESGRGKSTLSQSTATRSWSRLGDDIMPVCLDDENVLIIPRFPQLKRKQQYLDEVKKPLIAIFRLMESTGNKQIECKLIQGSEALITLSRHTAASLVFNGTLLAENMIFNQKVLSRTPVYNLSYPRDMDYLDNVRHAVNKVLQGI